LCGHGWLGLRPAMVEVRLTNELSGPRYVRQRSPQTASDVVRVRGDFGKAELSHDFTRAAAATQGSTLRSPKPRCGKDDGGLL
jgi:hypothetical protein